MCVFWTFSPGFLSVCWPEWCRVLVTSWCSGPGLLCCGLRGLWILGVTFTPEVLGVSEPPGKQVRLWAGNWNSRGGVQLMGVFMGIWLARAWLSLVTAGLRECRELCGRKWSAGYGVQFTAVGCASRKVVGRLGWLLQRKAKPRVDQDVGR